MPKNAEGYKLQATWQPVGLLDQLGDLARRNRRTVEEEVRHALERHLAAPPTVSVIVDAEEYAEGRANG